MAAGGGAGIAAGTFEGIRRKRLVKPKNYLLHSGGKENSVHMGADRLDRTAY